MRAIRGDAPDVEREPAWKRLHAHLATERGWSERDASLLVAYGALDLGAPRVAPADRHRFEWPGHKAQKKLVESNLGVLSAIGEQKATQFLAHLASRFDPTVAATYEGIFAAWGGDVRERAVDLESGRIRPRELSITSDDLATMNRDILDSDPTIYARIDYLDDEAELTDSERATCEAVLRNLPVVFTFAPMNLLHYRLSFAPEAEQIVAVNYNQYACLDTGQPRSYQLAYVLHPATLWDHFGAIDLEVLVPEDVPFTASVPLERHGTQERETPWFTDTHAPVKMQFATYRATLDDKAGELYLAVDADAWEKVASS